MLPARPLECDSIANVPATTAYHVVKNVVGGFNLIRILRREWGREGGRGRDDEIAGSANERARRNISLARPARTQFEKRRRRKFRVVSVLACRFTAENSVAQKRVKIILIYDVNKCIGDTCTFERAELASVYHDRTRDRTKILKRHNARTNGVGFSPPAFPVRASRHNNNNNDNGICAGWPTG